jgi:hypothetical protein
MSVWIDLAESLALKAASHLEPARDFLEACLSDRDSGEGEESLPGPTCALLASEGVVAGLDKEGRITTRDTASEVSGLPVLTGLPALTEGPGEKASLPQVVLGLGILRVFEQAPQVMSRLSEINLEDLEQPRVVLSGGIVADLGQGGYADKVQRLHQVMVQAAQLNIKPKRIDLRFGCQVIVECDKDPRGTDKEV